MEWAIALLAPPVSIIHSREGRRGWEARQESDKPSHVNTLRHLSTPLSSQSPSPLHFLTKRAVFKVVIHKIFYFFSSRSIWVAKCSLVFLQRAYQRSSVNHTARSASVDEVRVSVATALSFVFPSPGGCHCSCQLPTPPLFPLTPSKPETQGVSDFSQESKVQELRRGGECFQEVFRKYSSQVNQMLQSFHYKYRCYTYNQYLPLMCHKASFFFFFHSIYFFQKSFGANVKQKPSAARPLCSFKGSASPPSI